MFETSVKTNRSHYTNSADEVLVGFDFGACAAFLFINKDNPNIRCFSHIAPRIYILAYHQSIKILSNVPEIFKKYLHKPLISNLLKKYMSTHFEKVSTFMKSKGQKQLVFIHNRTDKFKELEGTNAWFFEEIMKKYKSTFSEKFIYSAPKFLPKEDVSFSVFLSSKEIKIAIFDGSCEPHVIPFSDLKNDVKEHSEKEPLLDNEIKKKSFCCCF